jgi:hypothetical protein
MLDERYVRARDGSESVNRSRSLAALERDLAAERWATRCEYREPESRAPWRRVSEPSGLMERVEEPAWASDGMPMPVSTTRELEALSPVRSAR